jgi:hypothetical protein
MLAARRKLRFLQGNCDQKEKQSFVGKTHELSRIKKVIGIVSGKGGRGQIPRYLDARR